MPLTEGEARQRLGEYGQEHVLRYWDELDDSGRASLLAQIGTIDFKLMQRLIDEWILNTPEPETFDNIEPVPVYPKADMSDPRARKAWEAGEEALREGRVGLFLVAGGQGTRLGFSGPKGAYPIGPVSKRPLFAFHAEKIHNLQNRYGCVLPWYIMVSATNHEATEDFFRENDYFGLKPQNIMFFEQRMVPCVSEGGKFMLDAPDHLAMNPNGHGGCLPAMVDNGVLEDARRRGIDTLSYFQVDNWAVKVADPFFIGYHVLADADMSSKNHRKNDPREAVGVHCICDGVYHVIEYSELDIYTQLLETDEDGDVIYYAGNPAMHIISTDFVDRVVDNYDKFPWHAAHKKIPYLNEEGEKVKPEEPNGYKFETFVFDALRFISHDPVCLEIDRMGEYTPIKSFEGPNSVKAAWKSMRAYWGEWLEAAGADLERCENGEIAVEIEISPQFALTKDEFLEKTKGWDWPKGEDIAIGPSGEFIQGE